MVIEYSISVGNILTLIGMIGVSMTFIYTIKNEISLVQRDVAHLEDGQTKLTEAFSQLGKILTAVAVQDSRINMIERRFDELSHGRGFIRNKKHEPL
jgi:hypothetical protein